MPATATPRKPQTLARKLVETRNTSRNRGLAAMLGLGESEKELARDFGSGLNDVIGRGTLASLIGLPGDLGGLAENGIRSALGMPQVQPYGGSEHIGQKLEEAGLVSPVRRPKTELLASLISPSQAASVTYRAPQMARAGVRMLDNLAAPRTMGSQTGAIDPDLLRQLVSDASKYESANDFRKAYVAEHLMDLSNPQNHRIGRLIEDGVDEDTMRYMDAKYTADMYGRRGNNEYKYQREAMVPDVNTPDDMVTIYRGTDPAQKDMIPGDFVSFNRDYAAGHGDNVLSMRVPARDVVFQGNDFHEWIYSPEKLRGDKYEGGLDKVWEMSRNGQPIGNLGKMVAPQDEALRLSDESESGMVGLMGSQPKMSRPEIIAKAKALGISPVGKNDEILAKVSILERDPSTWSPDDFSKIADDLHIHQDYRGESQNPDALNSILTDGLTRGMADNLGHMYSKKHPTFGNGLSAGRSFIFPSRSIKYMSDTNPWFAPGNKPMFYMDASEGQDIYEAIRSAKRNPNFGK